MVEGLARQGEEHRSNMPAVGVIASCIPLVMIGMVVVLRSGYPTPVRGLMEIVGLSLLVVNAAALSRSQTWYRCGLAISLYVFLFVIALGFSPLGENTFVVLVLSVMGVSCLARNLFRTLQDWGALATLGLILLGLFLGTYCGSTYWEEGEHDILYPEAVVTGTVRADVAFQAAIVNMISTYRVASTGVDGLVRLKYHNGSLWGGEALRRLCRMPAIDFVAFGYGIVALPFYVATFFGLAESLRSSLNLKPARLPLTAWFAGAVVLVGLVPYIENPVRANFNLLILDSDSFILGLGLVFILGGMAAKLYESHAERLVPSSGTERIILALAIPGALAIIGFVKITLMYMVLALLCYLWLRVRSVRSWIYTTGIALSAMALGLMLRAETGAAKSEFAFLSFDRVHPEWIPYFFLVHFVWVWILAIVWAVRYRVHSLADVREALRAKLSLPLELVIVSAIAGLIPYFVLYFNSPAWLYFTSFHALLAGAFVVALQPEVQLADIRRRFRDGTLPSSALLTFAIVLIVAGHLGATTCGSAYRLLKRNGEVRALLAGREASAWRSELQTITSPSPVLDQSLLNRKKVVACLSEIGGRPRGEREGTVLYIPKTNRGYWDMRQTASGTTPFLAPAFSGVAMVDGLPEYDDIGWAAIGWGYPQYQLPTHPEPAQENLGQAVEDARKGGFRKLLVLRGVSAAGCWLDEINLN